MRSQNSFSERIQRSKRSLKRHRKLVTCLAAVVVFAVTYSLVLPAVTLDEQKAEETPGIETHVEEQAAPEKSDAVSEQKAEPKKEANEEASSKSEAAQSQSEQKNEQAGSAKSDSNREKAESHKAKSDSKDADSSKDEKKVGDSKKDKDIKLIEEKTEIKYDGNGYKIIAEVGADAKLPADTKLKVREIKKGDKDKNDNEIVYDAYCDEALTAVRNQDGEDGENLERQVKLYDLKFVSESSDKEKVEPAAPVKVTIEYDEAIDRSDKNAIRMVHFDDTDMDKDKAAEAMIDKDKLHEVKKVVLETKSEKNDADSMKDVQFKSDRFSVYGLVYTVTKEASEQANAEEENKNTLTASDDNYEITVTYGDDAQIPEGAELRVEKIAEDDEAYAALQEDVANNLDDEEMTIPKKPVLFDISIWVGDQEIEPAEGSKVNVEVKLASDAMDGMFTGEDAPLLVNDDPIDEEMSDLDNSIQVIHQVEEGKLEVMETEDEITEDEATSSFTTDSFSNWLLYLDEDLTDINVTTGDSLTLRPYSEWVWKASDEESAYKNGQWTFPSSDWNVSTRSENGVQYTIYTHKTNGSVFRSFSKYDDQLQEEYTVVTSESLKAGTFDIQTNKGKTIHVHVKQGSASGKPSTVNGISGLTVNLFDYDVPTKNDGSFDFTRSGDLDDSNNTANNPSNKTLNKNHDLKFLGWGASNNSNDRGWFWINDYTHANPSQGIVKNSLGSDGAPVLTPNRDTGQERGNPGLGYLFDTSSKNSNVYAFPNADGLFQKDNQGYYYYNSNSNYAEYDRASNSFILYEHTYSQNTGGSNGSNAKPFGFFPFHEYDTSETQPGMNHNKNLNHHFGMSMTVKFEIPKDRQMEDELGNKHDIIYEFSGDDDLWVFVDDELALDIGGIHQPVTGTINFTTGEIKVHGVNDITKTFDVGGHTLKMFYIERGGCDSNLSVRFNLPLTKGNGKVKVIKKTETNAQTNPDTLLPGAVFGIWENANCEGEPYKQATSNSKGEVDFGEIPVKDEGQTYYLKEIKAPSGYITSTKIYTVTAGSKNSDGEYVFTVKDGNDEIEKLTQEPYDPVIRNKKAEPINLTIKKQWQDAEGKTLDNPDATAKFELKRVRSYVNATSQELITEEDTHYSEVISLPKNDGANEHTFNNLTIKETVNNVDYEYKYYVVEKNVPDGFEAVYVDNSGKVISNPSNIAINETGEQTVINRKLLDVPVEKYWPDYSGEQFTWTATFQLEKAEQKVGGTDQSQSSFAPVEGKTITVTKDQSPVPKFENLPMYRSDEDGNVYRIIYSVEEIAYEVKQGDTVVAKWSEDNGLEVGQQYTPQFEQDAGENGDTVEDYKIIVINTLKNRTATKEISIGVKKTWPGGVIDQTSSDQYAKFVLKRYVHEEYRDYSKISADTEWVDITLRTDTAATAEGNRLQKLRVPKGTTMYIVGKIKPKTNANKIVFNDGENSIELVKDNSQSQEPLEFGMTFVADRSKEVNLTQGDNYVIGGRDGFRLSDTYGNRIPDEIDPSFSEEFTLNNSDGWEKMFSHLSAIEEDDHAEGSSNQTIHVYSYFIEEIESNPDGFAPVFKDSHGQLIGDSNNRISWDAEFIAENSAVPVDITVKKYDIKDIDNESAGTLKGATFRLEKYTSAEYTAKDPNWTEQTIADTNTGTFNFTGLQAGFYKIVEVKTPAGYVKSSEDPTFEVRLDGTRLKVFFEDTNNVKYTDQNGFRVGNEPGAALPNSGGPGTTWMYILGSLLTLMAGVTLVARRRMRA